MTNSNQVLNPIEDQAPSGELETSSNYEAVKYNAMTHGILSRHTVLPHEDRREYEMLLSLLTQEHQPQGMTDVHLVEELAGIIWRKQRGQCAHFYGVANCRSRPMCLNVGDIFRRNARQLPGFANDFVLSYLTGYSESRFARTVIIDC